MAGTGKKWFLGCGIGCGMMLLIGGGVGTCGYFQVKKIIDQAEGIEEKSAAVEARFGDPADFVPAADGTISPDRLEVFLSFRDDMAPTRVAASDLLLVLDDEGKGNFIAKAKAGMGLIPSLIGFIGLRNEALLENGMGVGEYQNIYVLSYYILLEKDLSDGPSFTLADSDDGDSDSGVNVNWGVSAGRGNVGESRAERVRESANRLQRKLLANQLEALRATLPVGQAVGDDPWGAQLEAELAAMRDEVLRLPWEEGLPEQLRASLEPFRDRLDMSYDAMTAIIETGLATDD